MVSTRLTQQSGVERHDNVPTDRRTVDIFTKPLGLDKLREFSSTLGLQRLDMPNLMGRKERREDEVQAESDEDFDFRTAEEAEDGYGGSYQKREPET